MCTFRCYVEFQFNVVIPKDIVSKTIFLKLLQKKKIYRRLVYVCSIFKKNVKLLLNSSFLAKKWLILIILRHIFFQLSSYKLKLQEILYVIYMCKVRILRQLSEHLHSYSYCGIVNTE